MEFRILGPLEVLDEQGVVALGGTKPRAVLAVLLLHANEPVGAERLASALWGDDAPAHAIKTVQVHVSRLRKALGDPAIVTTTPAGYRLRVRPGELDAHRFAEGVDEGRAALDAGDPERAATVLREALALWRGPPLADLAFEPFAPREIARLEEERLVALELRLEADLARGRHDALAGELQQLAAEHPTARSGSGISTRATPSPTRSAGMPTTSEAWRSTPTGGRSPPAAPTRRSGSGTPAPGAPSGNP